MSEEQRPNQERDKQNSYEDKFRNLIGGVGGDVFWFFLDITFVWPDHHKEAYWFGIGYAILRFIEIRWFRLRTTMAVVIMTTVLGFVGEQYLPKVPIPETPTSGELVPANDPTPHNSVCDAHLDRISKDALWVFLGDSVATLSGLDKRGTPLPIIQLGNCALLSISQRNNGIAIDADIFTPGGFLAVRIKNNDFNLVSQEISYSESRATDQSTLIVYDRVGNEMLWVHYTNTHAIQVRGVFNCPNYNTIIVDKNSIRSLGNGIPPISDSCINVRNADTAGGVMMFR